jgi:hypothetical protein
MTMPSWVRVLFMDVIQIAGLLSAAFLLSPWAPALAPEPSPPLRAAVVRGRCSRLCGVSLSRSLG